MIQSEALAGVRPFSDKRIAVRVTPDALRHVKRGHPWVFDGSIVSESFSGEAGDLAVIFDSDRKFAAIGLYDPRSPIRIRVLHRGRPATINRDFWREKVSEALGARADLAAGNWTTGYRIINGENDGFPGLVVDRYAEVLVLKVYSTAWLPHLVELLPVLEEINGVDAVVLRLARNVSSSPTFGLTDGQLLTGDIAEPVLFRENGLIFESHVLTGQKTGHFLDQRENRQRVRERVRERAEGCRVLDVFSCTGGFSVYAAAGGARLVHSVDSNESAIETARRNFVHNQVDVASATHETTVGDAFDVMTQLSRKGDRFDIVVVDPPSFAKKKSDISRGLRSYGRLTDLALALLAPGGTLVQASCSSRITADDFYDAIQTAAVARGTVLGEVERTGHATDHPIGFAEGSYLKAVFARS